MALALIGLLAFTGAAAVWLAAGDFAPELALFAALGLPVTEREVLAPEAVTARVASVGGAEVWMLPPSSATPAGRRVVGVSLRVSGGDGRRLIPPAETHGMWLELWGP